MAADIRSADIVQADRRVQRRPRDCQFPVQHQEIAQAADPTTQTFKVRVAMKAPPDVNVLPGMTATVTLTYRRAGSPGPTGSSCRSPPSSRTARGSKWRGSSGRIKPSRAAR